MLAKTVLTTYLVLLLWLVLFKFSADPLSVLENYQSRSVNLVPLAGILREMVDNFIAFVPFGLLLAINFKHIGIWQNLMYICMFSIAAEATQFVFAIGTTDVTDVITNTLGGLFGLATYGLVRRYIDNRKLDAFILIILTILFVLFILLRLFVFKVRY